jgi:type IV fimbrial biogenesis protein FimT
MRAFTLVELLIVLTLLGVSLGLVLPAFSDLLAAVRNRAEASRLLSAIHLVRSEAIKRNRSVSLCPYAAGVSPDTCSNNYADGWIAFVNGDRDRALDPGEVVLLRAESPHADVSVSNRKGTRAADELITYYPDGSSRRNLTLMVCSRERPGATSWSVVLNLVGRPRLARDWGECPGQTAD